MAEASTFLKDQQSNNSPEVSERWAAIEDFYSRKLWHQVTENLMDIVKLPCYSKGTHLIDMYKNFLSEFEQKINPLSLVEILCPYVIRQYTVVYSLVGWYLRSQNTRIPVGLSEVNIPSGSISHQFDNLWLDATEALAFLTKVKDKVKSSVEATVLCFTAIGNIHLVSSNKKETKAIIEECEQLLNTQHGVTSVHARFYELCSNFHQVSGNHNEYYKDALRFLGCADLDQIPIEEKQERAFYLGLAGLLGNEVYNFGELLQHPVLESLRDTPRQWLIDLLYAFNSGDIAKMDGIKSAWGSQMTFTRPANHRQISFQEIAAKTGIPLGEVEILAMKAMSLGLVKGTIDQVTEKVHMTWVQPRVLDKQQIGRMKERLDDWCKDVTDMEKKVEQKASDILT